MTRELVHVSTTILPSADANAVQVAMMCDAFAGLGRKVTLRAERGEKGSVATSYALRNAYRIRSETPMTHLVWKKKGRQARATLRASGDEVVYFGRWLPTLSKLARWGYAAGLELHHPPRTQAQSSALAAFITAPGLRGLVVLVGDAGLRERVACSAPERLRHFTWENRAARIIQFLFSGRPDR